MLQLILLSATFAIIIINIIRRRMTNNLATVIKMKISSALREDIINLFRIRRTIREFVLAEDGHFDIEESSYSLQHGISFFVVNNKKEERRRRKEERKKVRERER